MASTSHAVSIAEKIQRMSGRKTYLVRRQSGDVDVWHGGKKRRFNTNQAAQTYLDMLYRCYIG